MITSVPVLGLIFITLASIFYWLRIAPAVTAALAFFGIVFVGDAGWLTRMLADLASWAQNATSAVTLHLIGWSAAAVLTIAIGAVVIHDFHPRKQAGRRTIWLGVALGVLIVSGLTGIPALDGVRSGIDSAAGNFLSVL